VADRQISESRLVSGLKPLSRILQVAANVLAVLYNVVHRTTPFLKHLLESLAANALPIALEPTDMMLDIGTDLIGDLLIKLDEYLTQLAHQIGIYMNCSHQR
jgi:hypothetical protein